MPDYEYDNLPEDLNVDPLPKDLFAEAFGIITEAIGDDHANAAEIRMAHVYDRKGYLEADKFGGPRNPAYSSPTDDIVLQVTLRVRHPSTTRQGLEGLEKLEQKVRDRRIAAERKRLEAEIAAADAAALAARERLEKLK